MSLLQMQKTSSERRTQSHPVHHSPSRSSHCARKVLLFGARGKQTSVYMSSLCFCSQALMIYLHTTAAHESHTRLNMRTLAGSTDS